MKLGHCLSFPQGGKDRNASPHYRGVCIPCRVILCLPFEQWELFGGGGIVVRELHIGGYSFDTVCNGVFLIGAAWMILERLVVQDVRELKDGDLIQEVI